MNNDERPVLASRTITNGERRWESENICIQTRRHFPTEHDERYVLTRKFPETYLDDSAIFQLNLARVLAILSQIFPNLDLLKWQAPIVRPSSQISRMVFVEIH